MKRVHVLLSGLLVLSSGILANAGTFSLLSDGNDLSFWTSRAGTDDAGPGDGYPTFGTSHGIINVDSGSKPAGFGTGDVARVWDLSVTDKPEVQADISPRTKPFRIDFESYDESANDSSNAIRFRVANRGKSITSESRSAFSFSWQADGEITAKSEGGGGSVSTMSSDPIVGASAQTLIINPSTTDTYVYSLFGENRTLNPLSYDAYIDGVLFNNDNTPDEINGLEFTLTKSPVDFVPANGIGRIGLVGSSNSGLDPDYLFDNITLTDLVMGVPEPSSLILLIGSVMFMAGSRRK